MIFHRLLHFLQKINQLLFLELILILVFRFNVIGELTIFYYFFLWIFSLWISKLIFLCGFNGIFTDWLIFWVEWIFDSPIHLVLGFNVLRCIILGLFLNELGLIDLLFVWEFEVTFNFRDCLLYFLNTELFVDWFDKGLKTEGEFHLSRKRCYNSSIQVRKNRK